MRFFFFFFFFNGKNWSVICSGVGVKILVSEGCWSAHLLGMKEDCVLVVRGDTVVLLEFPSEIPQHCTETLVLAEPLC